MEDNSKKKFNPWKIIVPFCLGIVTYFLFLRPHASGEKLPGPPPMPKFMEDSNHLSLMAIAVGATAITGGLTMSIDRKKSLVMLIMGGILLACGVLLRVLS